jgi:hypothetical protein
MLIACPPPYTACYSVDQVGNLFNGKGRRKAGHLTSKGYVMQSMTDELGHDLLMLHHRLVHWTHDPTFDINDPNMEVDHRDGDTTNNHPSNLFARTKGDHILKTHADNPGRFSVKGAATRSVAVLHTDSVTGKVTPYASICLAAAEHDMTGPQLRDVLAAGASSEWAFRQKELAQERWYRPGADVIAYWTARGKPSAAQIEVSNMGRVRHGCRATFGSPTGNGYSFASFQVSWLVCVLFRAPPSETGMSVVHRDGRRENNREDNLAWSSCNTHVAPPVCCAVDVSGILGNEDEWRKEFANNLFDAVFGEAGRAAIRPGGNIELAVDGIIFSAERYVSDLPEGRWDTAAKVFSFHRRKSTHGKSLPMVLSRILRVAMHVTLERCANDPAKQRGKVMRLHATT